jgi:cancer susceptibility candidate protein 1
MALIQSRCADFPYKSWKIRCVDNEVAILDIETKRLTLTIEIGVGYMKLIESSEQEFKDLD